MMWDGVNRRRFLRVVFPYTIHIRVTNDRVISTYTDDISCGGVKIVVQEELTLGGLVDLDIFLAENPVHCQGKVVWIKAKHNIMLEGEKFYEAGIEFGSVGEKDAAVLQECVSEIEDKRRKEKERGP